MEKHWFAQGSGVDVSKNDFHLEGFFVVQNELKWHISDFCVENSTKRYLFCFKNMLQMDSGRKEQKMTKILIKSPGHVWKSRHRNNSDAFQNRLSGLNLTAEKAFDLKSAKTAKIHLPSRRLFPCPNGVPNGPIRKVSQRGPKVFKSIRVFQ